MKWLSRTEEMLLLAVHRLGDVAYGLSIRAHLRQVSGKRFSVGAVYVPLQRLEDNGLLESSESEPTSERGGRSKRLYRLTAKGLGALAEVKRLNDALWAGFPALEAAHA